MAESGVPGGTSTVIVTTSPVARRTVKVRGSAEAGKVNAVRAAAINTAAQSRRCATRLVIVVAFSSPKAPTWER